MPPSSDAADAPDGGRRPAILVVEDEALIALLLADVLAGAGYAPLWSAGEPDRRAAAAARAAVPGLGLAGGPDGRGVLRRLRRLRPGLPAVVVTGYGGGAPQADLRGLGGPTARLGKPVDPDALLEALAAALLAPPGPYRGPPRRAGDR